MQIRNHDDIMDILRKWDTGVDRILEDHGVILVYYIKVYIWL
jgi:hypothetical protein